MLVKNSDYNGTKDHKGDVVLFYKVTKQSNMIKNTLYMANT